MKLSIPPPPHLEAAVAYYIIVSICQMMAMAYHKPLMTLMPLILFTNMCTMRASHIYGRAQKAQVV